MYLTRARTSDVPPWGALELSFENADGTPRLMTVLQGNGGVGKTMLLVVLSCTRPGHAVALPARGLSEEASPHAVCDWFLGSDDPKRPHPLRIVSPNVGYGGIGLPAAVAARLPAAGGNTDEAEVLRRREQMLFDRIAQTRGFAFMSIASTRWFSRQPISLNAPGRSVARYDVRASSNPEDASRNDLTRETKQALAYGAISHALSTPSTERFSQLDSAIRATVNRLLQILGFHYEGLDAATLEPVFSTPQGVTVAFDFLPTQVRHLVAFGALPVRMLWAAYPDEDPAQAEGVVAIDELDLHQESSVHGQLIPALKEALPNVQWIVTCSSPLVASSCDQSEVFALRKIPERERVELFTGPAARLH